MSSKNMAPFFLLAVLGMGGKLLMAAGAPGGTVVVVAPVLPLPVPGIDYLAAVADADLLLPDGAAEPSTASPVPELNPYSLVLVGLGMLGVSTRRQYNEAFARHP